MRARFSSRDAYSKNSRTNQTKPIHVLLPSALGVDDASCTWHARTIGFIQGPIVLSCVESWLVNDVMVSKQPTSQGRRRRLAGTMSWKDLEQSPVSLFSFFCEKGESFVKRFGQLHPGLQDARFTCGRERLKGLGWCNAWLIRDSRTLSASWLSCCQRLVIRYSGDEVMFDVSTKKKVAL